MSDLIEQIAGLTSRINMLAGQRDELLQQWAVEVSQWTPGQVTKVRGYSFHGKSCRILTVKGCLTYRKEPEVRITARVLKKDGTDSSNTTHWTWQPGD